MADYNALFQAPNAGQAFAQSFQQGRQQARQDASSRAMQALAVDPTNQQALAALAAVNPEAAMSYQEKAQAHHLQQLTAHRENIKLGAQILKSVNPTDEATYQQALHLYVQGGGDPSEVPPHFDPQYVKNVVALDAQINPDHDNTAGDIREFQQAQAANLIPQGTSFQQFLQMKNPGMMSPVTIPANATVSMPGGGMPTVSSPDEAMKLPPGTQFRMPDGRIGTVPGGAGGNASGGFPTGPQ
jgi:hypothetical protein